jgi:hypothetical protein
MFYIEKRYRKLCLRSEDVFVIPILFAYDTSIIFTNSKSEDFKNGINIVFESLNKWFEANKLSLNFDETHYIQLTSKNSRQIDLDISYANKLSAACYAMR